MSDSDLLAAYLATVWSVDGPDGALEVRPGRIAPPPLRPSAIVTAYNPASQPRPAEENDRADADLRARIAAAGAEPWRTLARGTGDDAGAWDEPGWLIRGDVRGLAVALGAEFGQNAIVWIDAAGDVAIVVTRDGFCRTAVGEVVR
ncbi:MAG TPA: DUF3293 domain-containing protein [Longimicrobium sp.]